MQRNRTVFDGWRSLVIGLYMALAGYAVMVGIPVIITAWVDLLGFTQEQVGRVGGADLGGLAIGSLLASFVMGRINRRVLTVIGVVIAVVANGLCTVVYEYEWVLWLRLAAGIGSGIYTAVGVATLGASSKPAFAFNLMLFAFAFTQAGELWILPQLSMNGIYGAFIATYVFGLLFLGWLPPRPVDPGLDVELDVEHEDDSHHAEHVHIPAYIPWLVLIAIVFTYINIGSYWTYIEQAALDAGTDAGYVGRLLIWTSFFSLIGCTVATLISNRWGLARPLMIALMTMVIIVGMLSFGITDTRLLISMLSFNLLWIFVDVYQMSTIANVDRSGTFASLMPGAQGLGQIVGPNIAASILGWGMGYKVVFAMCASAAFVGLMVYAGMYVLLRKKVPALAKQS